MKRIFLFFATLWLGIMGARAQGYHYDVNNDSEVNINDVVALVNNILGKLNPDEVPVGEAVDLGLPSGTMWSSCNVGATKPEEYGGYYAWGETEEKEDYIWSTYIHCNGSRETCHDLGTDISGTEYDVAHHEWGGKWVMPTEVDFLELIDNCTSEWTTINGVKGRKYTSKINGNSIFLPAAGYRMTGEFNSIGSYGYYWSSTLLPSNSYSAYHLYFRPGNAYWNNDGRYYGQSVRPVYKN